MIARRTLSGPFAPIAVATAVLVAAISAGCAAPLNVETTTAPASGTEPAGSLPAASGSPIAGPASTVSPCAAPLRQVAQASQLMVDKLATIRGPLTASRYDGWEILGAARSANATLTHYAQRIPELKACPEAAALVERMEAFGREASQHIAIVLKAGHAAMPGPQAAMVALFELLPEVAEISEQAAEVADRLEIQILVAQLPDGASAPLGELAPIPTQPPSNVRTIAAAFFGSGVTVKTYTIGGSSPSGIIRSMNANGPYSSWIDGRASATTQARPDYRFTLSGGGSCRIVTADSPAIVIRYTVTLPTWSPPSGTARSTIDYWNELIVEIATHEKRHVDIYRDAQAELNAALRGATCTNFEARLEAVWEDTAEEQCRFDMDEYGYALGLSYEDCVSR